MYYTTKENFEYMQWEYVRSTAPVESFYRFQRVDDHFSPDTGAEPQEIIGGITKLFEDTKGEAHPIVKAKAFALIFENTRIN